MFTFVIALKKSIWNCLSGKVSSILVSTKARKYS